MNCIRETYVECLSQQLDEYEFLKSMYPGDNEIVLLDKNTIEGIKVFLSDENSEFIPANLDYIIKTTRNTKKMEVNINLPTLYPRDKPSVSVRCNKLSRQQETKLNSDLSEYLLELESGEVCIYSAISWIQEYIDNFKEDTQIITNNDITNQTEQDKFVRMWIVSHHIYNKRKREEIVKLAKELQLTGFCLSGKPGVVCIEGPEYECNEWWKVIKSMNWQKISVRKTECCNAPEKNKFHKFNKFEELLLSMSDFSKFMEKFGLTYIFNELFGFSN